MPLLKRLPDTEFEVMKAIWRGITPITTLQIMERLEPKNKWKPQTVMTILVRLIEKGFLKSEKNGKERNYTPIIREDEYLEIETSDFVKRYRGNSLGSLIKTLYAGEDISGEDLRELKEWFAGKGMPE